MSLLSGAPCAVRQREERLHVLSLAPLVLYRRLHYYRQAGYRLVADKCRQTGGAYVAQTYVLVPVKV
jgi:hypothetical protein